jgi:hypothetical protein
VPPAGSSSFADASYALEVRDLDGDGRADAAFTVAWTRELKTKDACKGCYRTVTEQATQLYVLSGGAPELRPAFTHLTAYTTQGESFPEGNDQAPPGPDDVAYEWSIEGKPPVLKLRRTKSQVAPNRWPSELDPPAIRWCPPEPAKKSRSRWIDMRAARRCRTAAVSVPPANP